MIALARKIYKQYPLTILFTAISFGIIWGLGLWKVFREIGITGSEVGASWFQILNAFLLFR
ncbi:hypothetical protein KUH03_10855 [Sphingobacterium sp. E70]|uniref:hypothetical protein n=1 Tax=Sphingobacterium sp. E70 TaxID=2853439 RepID=UPI00211C574D|nr:hypothetical protein [Sphingobacterium sp. E70]ULT27206.1 hypothetical protein KUH03_10855 [Sphingobacterium sp. E70]